MCGGVTHHQGMLMDHHATVLAVGTEVVVCALRAPEAMASLDLKPTVVAGACKGRSVRVV